jgi:hypothetical protein
MKILFVATFLMFLAAGKVSAQSPAQLRPQFAPPLPPTFTPPLAFVAPSRGPAVFPFVAPVGGNFQNGAQFGFVTRQGQLATTYAGPGYVGFQFSTPTRIGGR